MDFALEKNVLLSLSLSQITTQSRVSLSSREMRKTLSGRGENSSVTTGANISFPTRLAGIGRARVQSTRNI